MKRIRFLSLLVFSSVAYSCFSCGKPAEQEKHYDNYVEIINFVGGEFTNLTPDKHDVGDEIQVQVKAFSGYYLSALEISTNQSIKYVAKDTYSFVLEKGVNSLEPIFNSINNSKDCSLKTNTTLGGSIALSSSQSYLAGSTCDFSVKVDSGYKLNSLSINGVESYDASNKENAYSFTLSTNINIIDASFSTVDINVDENKYEVVDEFKIEKTIVETSINEMNDPYVNVNKDEFYANYKPATSYEDAYFRSKHYLISGDIAPQKHIPAENSPVAEKPQTDSGVMYKNALCRYEVDKDGNYISYTINTLDGSSMKVYYGAGYSSLDEVSAYLFAFGYPPANTTKGTKKGDSVQAVQKWGRYARLNIGRFSGDTSQYPFEPLLDGIMDKYNYYETDFGSDDEYMVGSRLEKPYYYNGNISRSACRFVFNFENKDGSELNLKNRHVYYTYNHYNDFEEYLNYKGGYTQRFGSQSVGNEPNDKNPPVKPSNPPLTISALFK